MACVVCVNLSNLAKAKPNKSSMQQQGQERFASRSETFYGARANQLRSGNVPGWHNRRAGRRQRPIVRQHAARDFPPRHRRQGRLTLRARCPLRCCFGNRCRCRTAGRYQTLAQYWLPRCCGNRRRLSPSRQRSSRIRRPAPPILGRPAARPDRQKSFGGWPLFAASPSVAEGQGKTGTSHVSASSALSPKRSSLLNRQDEQETQPHENPTRLNLSYAAVLFRSSVTSRTGRLDLLLRNRKRLTAPVSLEDTVKASIWTSSFFPTKEERGVLQ